MEGCRARDAKGSVPLPRLFLRGKEPQRSGALKQPGLPPVSCGRTRPNVLMENPEYLSRRSVFS
jgi:hypothetical protein